MSTPLRLRWFAIGAVLVLLVGVVVPLQARQTDTLGFQEGDCPFPALDGVTCGYLTVPEDRAQPDGNTVELAVAIIAARSANPDPIPVIYLEGGPGDAPLIDTDTFLTYPVVEDHTLILFDQRGTGFSQPSLNCPELEGDSSSDDPVQACHDRLQSEGVNLQMYNSAASAADVNDLAAALGYDKVNLWGISYGTKLGLTVLRDYPEIVQSAVLDSVYAPEVDDLQIQSSGVTGSLNELFSRCAADAACSDAYPNLESDFYAMLDAARRQPGQRRNRRRHGRSRRRDGLQQAVPDALRYAGDPVPALRHRAAGERARRRRLSGRLRHYLRYLAAGCQPAGEQRHAHRRKRSGAAVHRPVRADRRQRRYELLGRLSGRIPTGQRG